MTAAGEPTDPQMPATAPSWSDALVRAGSIALAVVLPVQIVSLVLVDDLVGRTAAEGLHRWDHAGLLALDWLVVVLGCLHAAHAGVRTLEGSRLGPSARTLIGGLVVAAAALVGAAMTFAVLTIDT